MMTSTEVSDMLLDVRLLLSSLDESAPATN